MKGKFTDAEKQAIAKMVGIQIKEFENILRDTARKMERVISLSSKGVPTTLDDVDRAIERLIGRLTELQLDPDGIFKLDQKLQELLQNIAIDHFICDELGCPDNAEVAPYVSVMSKMLMVEEFKETKPINWN